MEKDLIMLCRLWYITRESTQGQPVTTEMAEALTAYDKKVQDVIERNKIEWYTKPVPSGERLSTWAPFITVPLLVIMGA